MLAQSPSRSSAARAFSLPAVERALVMGIINVTPNSFSDGGEFLDALKAIAHARTLKDEGADLLDLGAESTRPYGGAKPVSLDEELARLRPVLSEAVALGVPVSVDTIKVEVAAWALEQGAVIITDLWGLLRDPGMARVVAEHGATVVVMHNREKADRTIDFMADVKAFFSRSLEIADKAGISRVRIVLDPGIGFGKTPEQSLSVLAHFGELRSFGLKLLVGLSRKRFIDAVSPAPPDQRLGGSIAGNLLAVLAGADIVRVHDGAETVQALRVAGAIRSAR
jgi:dihydropteroate synthase